MMEYLQSSQTNTSVSFSPSIAIKPWFCGGVFNQSTHECEYTSHDDNSTFGLSAGMVVYDRSTGATDAPTAASISHSAVIDIGIGVGVPLGVGLIIALSVAWWQNSRRHRAERRLLELQSELNRGHYGESTKEDLQGGLHSRELQELQHTRSHTNLELRRIDGMMKF